MLTKSLLVLFLFSSFLISCKQKESVESNINSYTNAVLASSQEIAKSTIRLILNSIDEKTHKPESRDSAWVYKPKADAVVKLGDSMTDYLDTLIIRISSNEKLEPNDSLFEKLKIFEATLVKSDTQVSEIFGNKILEIDTSIGFKITNISEFNNQFLKVASKNQTLAFLNSLKEDILNIEIKVLHYLDDRCGYRDLIYDKYYAIINQNTEQLKPNHILEITAGIGKFEFHPNAKFIVGKKEIPIKDSIDGVAIYKMRVLNEKGKHTLPVKITWTKPNGEPFILEKEVVYYVE